MKISELIKKLEKAMVEYGDLEVTRKDSEMPRTIEDVWIEMKPNIYVHIVLN